MTASNRNERWVEATDPREVPLPDHPPKATSATFSTPDGGGEIFYLDSGGSGDVILLLHPYTGSARSWSYQLPAFSQAGYRVIAPSSRGAYGTTAPPAPMPKLVEDAINLIDALKVERVHLLGSAFGGMIALRLAVKYPDRFISLTLACTLAGVREEAYLARQRALLEPEFMALPCALKELSPSYRHSNPAGVALWREIELESPSAAAKKSSSEGTKEKRKSALETGPDYEQLRKMSMPVHLIYGGADLYAPPTAARMLHEQFKDSQLTLLQETGHAAFWEQPFAFNESVLEFIKSSSHT